MIWITNLDGVGVEFLKRFLLRRRAHPIELLDAGAIRSFQVSHKIFDLLFCLCWEILCGVKLADPEPHRSEGAKTISNEKIAATNRRDCAFPTRLLFFLTGKCFGMQLKVSVGEWLGKIGRGIVRNMKS